MSEAFGEFEVNGDELRNAAGRSLPRSRQTKFTPSNIRQITNLVERGKSRDEIAEIIGVTPATLAVTCSRLKISLRRPAFDVGTGLLRQRRRRSPNGVNARPSNEYAEKRLDQMEEQLQPQKAPRSEVQAIASPLTSGSEKTSDPVSPKFGIRMQYKNDDRTIELPLDTNMVGRLCIEAEFRNTKIGDLLARLIKTIAERDLFQLVLEPPSSGRLSQSFQLPS